ncbi:MAG: sigma-70 family RNA polymerase sigma factor [Sphingomonas bacterium]
MGNRASAKTSAVDLYAGQSASGHLSLLRGLRAFFVERVRPDEVDDLVQDVALRMELRGGAQDIEHHSGYMFRVARTLLVDRARADRSHARSAHEPLEEWHHPVEERSPERVMAGKDELDRVLTALHELPERTRQAFILHRFDEMSYTAIARHMGVSVSAVEKHIKRAMRILAARFED